MSELAPASLLPATTHTPAQTEALGQRLALLLEAGDVLALHGDLGAGKTHFVRGLCVGLGIAADSVSSPTFTLVQEYSGRLPVFHMDAYRLRSADELLDLGFDDYLSAGGVCIVEWPSRVAELLPTNTRHLLIEHGGGDVRHLCWLSADAE